MQIKDVDKLKAWLLGKLEPLCDADPVALAKYVVALLRKEKPKADLKGLCIDQLEVFLSKETSPFVEKLFRCLESESYMKGEDPPKSPPSSSAHVPARVVERVSENVHSSSRNEERRHSEDFRHKEVDDDDRDFRRSRRHDSEAFSGGGRRIVAPIQVSSYGSRGGGGGGSNGGSLLGKKRGLNSLPDGPNKRRMVIDHSRDPDPHHRSVSGVSSNSLGGLRRSVRDRLGPRPDINRNDPVLRRKRRSSSSSSTSSSSSQSSSECDSSTGSSGKWSKRRKSRKTTSTTTTTTTTSTNTTSVAIGGGAVSKAEEEGANAKKKKQRCADYDKKGFCILGESCPYDHGLDPVVIGSGLPAYPHPHPHPAPGIGIPTLPPPAPPATNHDCKSESYNPEEPGLSPTTCGSTGFIPTHMAPPPALALRAMFPPPPPHLPGMLPSQPPHLPPFPPPNPFIPPPAMIGPPSTFHRPHPSFPTIGMRGPPKPSDALIVRKIPKELNTITKLSSHFEKFGTIVNLTVRYEGDLEGAMVQFSSMSEAKTAHDSAEAVLNNRFIKVYYLRRDSNYGGQPALKESSLEGPVSVAVSAIAPPAAPHVAASQEMGWLGRGGGAIRRGVVATLPSSTGGGSSTTSRQEIERKVTSRKLISKPELKKLGDVTVSPATSNPVTTPKVLHPPPASTFSSSYVPISTAGTTGIPPHTHAAHHHHQQQQQQQPQRRSTSEVTIKKLELHKKTQELMKKQIEQQKKLIEKLEKSGKSLSAEEKNVIMKSLKSLSVSIGKLKDAANKTVLSQRQDQQNHGKELSKGQLEKNKLKERAEALRKEAHKLGLISSPSQPLPTSVKGRGKAGTGSTKPRQLLVIGVQDKDQMVSFFESFGSLDSVEVDPANPNNLIFTFQHSSVASQVTKSASMFKGKPLIMKWYQPKPAPPTSTTLPIHTSLSTTHQSLPYQHHHQQQQLSRVHGPRPASGTDVGPNNKVSSLTTPTLAKPDPQDLHLVEDSEDEEDTGEERAWRR